MPMPYGAMRDTFNSSDGIYDFILTPERIQVMRPGAPIPRYFRIKARLDQDGLGGKDQSGDLTGGIARLAAGSADVRVNINKAVK
jgi:hypothetical protein